MTPRLPQMVVRARFRRDAPAKRPPTATGGKSPTPSGSAAAASVRTRGVTWKTAVAAAIAAPPPRCARPARASPRRTSVGRSPATLVSSVAAERVCAPPSTLVIAGGVASPAVSMALLVGLACAVRRPIPWPLASRRRVRRVRSCATTVAAILAGTIGTAAPAIERAPRPLIVSAASARDEQRHALPHGEGAPLRNRPTNRVAASTTSALSTSRRRRGTSARPRGAR